MRRQELKGTYTVPIECSNCDYNGTAELPKGTPASSVTTCPNCGCKTAHKRGPKDILPFVPRRVVPSPFPRPWYPDGVWTEPKIKDNPSYIHDGPLPEIRFGDNITKEFAVILDPPSLDMGITNFRC